MILSLIAETGLPFSSRASYRLSLSLTAIGGQRKTFARGEYFAFVDLSRGRVWGYEALVRGPNGEPAFSILDRITDGTRYRFDQAARVMAIETAGAIFKDPDLRLSINFMPNAVYEPGACIQKSLAAAKRANFPIKNSCSNSQKTNGSRILPMSNESLRLTEN